MGCGTSAVAALTQEKRSTSMQCDTSPNVTRAGLLEPNEPLCESVRRPSTALQENGERDAEVPSQSEEDHDEIKEEMHVVAVPSAASSTRKEGEPRTKLEEHHLVGHSEESWFEDDLLQDSGDSSPIDRTLGRESSGDYGGSVVVFNTLAEGSNSTARLSVNSGSSGDVVDSFPSREHDAALAFFSPSIFAPHTPQDSLELQKRLNGGYFDHGCGLTYITPKQRWATLLQETILFDQMRSTGSTPTAFMSGAGVLWADLSDGSRGLPAPLPRPAARVPAVEISPRRFYSAKEHVLQQKLFHQLLTSLTATLPDFEEMLVDSDIASYSVHRCAIRVKEFFNWSADTAAVNPNHQRLRAILGQLQVSLRDTAILLEDPKRYIGAFARIDPQGLMFQAEILSLQEELVSERLPPNARSQREGFKTAPATPADTVTPISNETISKNPLQDSFLDEAATTRVRLSATKAREVLSTCPTLPLGINQPSNADIPSTSGSAASAQQWVTALALFRRRAFYRLQYVLRILRNTVEVEAWYFEREGKLQGKTLR